ncbi:hypothetical protein [Aureimonas sp. Leaf324]|uniref:hypothetical protein n=1 Tax=Aureimonas sp. Leaf324 TaxID=1736336 RepID=UPI0006FBDAC5|nr:hypothetical protein [Aureimonas sp. Leaf324]KQQ90969.1 hypothetical protein ASF65_00040 [Aureimonas sp. Leaf324]
MTVRTVRLDGFVRLKSPLSHIGETISNTSYLVEDSVLQQDGNLEKVFCYSGNAWRGQIRDLMSSYMLDALGRPRLSLDAFHLLYSGGRMGGSQVTDLAAARAIKATIPIVSLLGGGVGNQILEGKARFGSAYPLCRQAMPVLPSHTHAIAEGIDYADLTMMKEYSRRDDAKISSIAAYLPQDEGADEGAKKRRADPDGVADQMRIRAEFVSPGTTLHSWIVLQDVSDVEIGCLVSGLHCFSRSPHIGGKAASGHGLVDLSYTMKDLDTGEVVDFLSVRDGETALMPPAREAKAAYDQHLRTIYDNMLADSSSKIVQLLGAA